MATDARHQLESSKVKKQCATWQLDLWSANVVFRPMCHGTAASLLLWCMLDPHPSEVDRFEKASSSIASPVLGQFHMILCCACWDSFA